MWVTGKHGVPPGQRRIEAVPYGGECYRYETRRRANAAELYFTVREAVCSLSLSLCLYS